MRQRKVYMADEHKQQYEDSYNPDLDHHYDLLPTFSFLSKKSLLIPLLVLFFSLYITISGATNATSMDIFQDDTQQWNDRLNTATHIFKEQMDMILEARNDNISLHNKTRRSQICNYKHKDRELALAHHKRWHLPHHTQRR